MKKIFVVNLLLISFAMNFAFEIAGVNFPDPREIDHKKLVLNGTGIRKKFVIKVYACGLYLEEKNNDSQKIIDSDAPMIIRMHFLYRKVGNQKLIEAWNEGFEKYENFAKIKMEIDKFNALFTKNALKNDVYELIYTPRKGTDLVINGETLGTVGGLEFKKALFSIWLSKDTSLPNLREDLLGKTIEKN